MADDVDIVDAGELPSSDWTLGGEGPPPLPQRPWWLVSPPRPKAKSLNNRWPSGAKSPSWFKRFMMCPRNHSQRYRHKRPDPSGVDALVGKAVHGTFEDAGNRRLQAGRERPLCPPVPSTEELLHLLEFQPEIAEGQGTEVLARSREIIQNLAKPLSFKDAWATEFIWSFYVTPNLRVAGIADLIRVIPDPRNPRGAPICVVVGDYKTGPGQCPTKEELESDPQVVLELAWARINWPQTPRIRFHLMNVSQNHEAWCDWTPQVHETALAMARACWNLWSMGTETATVSKSCVYCPYRSDCKAYGEELRKEAFRPKGSIEDMTLEQLAEELNRCRTIAKMSEQRKKDCSEAILGKLGAKQTSYRGDRFLVVKKRKQTENIRCASDTLVKLAGMTGMPLEQLIDAVCKVQKGKLDGLVNTLPEHLRKTAAGCVKAQSTPFFSDPWIEVREQEPLF